MLRLNPGNHVVLSAVVTDMAADILARVEEPIGDPTPRTALSAAANLTRRLLSEVPEAADRALGVGVGVSGHVDPGTGLFRYSSLLDWDQVDVAGPLHEATSLPVVDTFAVVTVGPGIGCGFFLDGALFSGATGLAGEFGHLPLDPAGPLCRCGRRGCVEALAGDRAVLRHLRDAGVTCTTIEEAAHLAHAAFAEAGAALGRGLAGLCNLLNPRMIVVAGEGAAAHDLFGPAMSQALQAHAFSDAALDCSLRVDPVPHDLWAWGASSSTTRWTVPCPEPWEAIPRPGPPAPTGRPT
ncbi:ROK family protein [Streptomyces microflavus]|uniref:ROK family protein n=1 Tax=Streptomyces microflavus TaxID=1919 RepID=UPI0037FE0391